MKLVEKNAKDRGHG